LICGRQLFHKIAEQSAMHTIPSCSASEAQPCESDIHNETPFWARAMEEVSFDSSSVFQNCPRADIALSMGDVFLAECHSESLSFNNRIIWRQIGSFGGSAATTSKRATIILDNAERKTVESPENTYGLRIASMTVQMLNHMLCGPQLVDAVPVRGSQHHSKALAPDIQILTI
jgi:hypothetical protein